jgi:hypothetical protein
MKEDQPAEIHEERHVKGVDRRFQHDIPFVIRGGSRATMCPITTRMIASPLARSISTRKSGRRAIASRDCGAVVALFAVPQSAVLVIVGLDR